MKAFHIPVLLEEILKIFDSREVKVFVDGTLGAGGHAEALLTCHSEIDAYWGFDQDEEALLFAKKRLEPFNHKLHCIHDNFQNLSNYISSNSADGILLDIGVSSLQFDKPEKGFSLRKEGPLDMRMDASEELTAEFIVNRFSEKHLGQIFKEFGEEPRWRQAALAIVKHRQKKKIHTTLELVDVLAPVLRKGGKIHPATLIFQALRIAVNNELEVLKKGLERGFEALRENGLFAVISFHSLEDRIVKNYFRDQAKEKKARLITKKPICASLSEIRKNPRSRSAKLRVLEKSA